MKPVTWAGVFYCRRWRRVSIKDSFVVLVFQTSTVVRYKKSSTTLVFRRPYCR